MRTGHMLLAVALLASCASGANVGDAGVDASSDSDCVWDWQHRRLSAPYLMGVWGRAEDDLWIFGPDTWQHFDGGSWAEVAYAGGGWRDRVHGDFDGSVWALVGGRLLRGNGTEFEIITAFDSQEILARDLFARDDGVYVVGHWSTMSEEVPIMASIARFDGEDLEQLLPAEGPASMEGMLRAVWGDADELFAVGQEGLVIRYDGLDVEPLTSGVGAWLYDVSGVDSSDVYAAGTDGTVIHYDGSAWSEVDVPGLGDRTVYAVHAAPAGEVFLAASNGYDPDQAAVNDQEIWDSAAVYERVGDTFVELSPGFVGDPRGLWWDSGRLYVAGTRGGELLEMLEAGDAWTLYYYPHIGGIDRLDISDTGTVCAVAGETVKLLTDGTWHVLSDDWHDRHQDVAAAPDGRFWIASRNSDGDRPALWIADADGIEAADGIDHATTHLREVDVDPDGNVWTAGNSWVGETDDWESAPALVLVREGGEWHDISPPDITGSLWGLGATEGHAFVSGSVGLLHYDGVEWSLIHDSADGYISDIVVLAPDRVYTDSEGGLMLWDGEGFSPVSGVEGVRVFEIAADPDGNLWVAGDLGLHSDTAVLLRRGEDGWQTMVEHEGPLFMRAAAPLVDIAHAASTSDFYTGELVCTED